MIGARTLHRLRSSIRVGDPDRRYCEAHRAMGPRAGGGYLITMGGLRRKWLCADCLNRALTSR